jgi:DNA-binding response OmpR family regulator
MSNIIDLSPRIILLKNDAKFAELILTEFERDGYLIKWLINSDDILNIIKYFIPNIIILNWNTVSEGCLNLIAEIRQNQRLNEMKLIVISDVYSDNSAIRALKVGADDY